MTGWDGAGRIWRAPEVDRLLGKRSERGGGRDAFFLIAEPR